MNLNVVIKQAHMQLPKVVTEVLVDKANLLAIARNTNEVK